MNVFTLFLSLIPIIAWGINFDTATNNILIIHDNSTLFEIPISSVNAEFPKIKLKSNLGSIKFDLSPYNKAQPFISECTKSQIAIHDGKEQINLFIHPNGELSISSTSAFTSFAFINLENEKFYGGGIQFSHELLNGQKIVNLCEENGIGRGDQPISRWTHLIGIKGEKYSSYYPIPFVISDKKRGFFIQSSDLSTIEFEDNNIQLELFGKETQIELYQDSTMLNIIKHFNKKNGRGKSAPKWAIGNIVGVQGGTAEVKRKITPLLSKNIPIQGIWIQDWVGKRETKIGSRLNWKWQLDSSYNDIFNYAEEHRLKVLGYINPFFAEEGYYTEIGIEKGYFLQEKGKIIEFDFGGMNGYMLDIFNETAREWMKDIIRDNLLKNGFSGWMADFAEWYPINSILDVELHNKYTHEWVKLNHEILQESNEELYIFHRSGNTGTSSFTQGLWYGDQLTNYGLNDGIGSVFNAMISGGLSGLPPGHSDIGGYTSIKKPIVSNILRSEQLLKDWIALEAFTPFFRSHEGLLPDDNLQIYSNEDIRSYYGKYAKIHHDLSDYFVSLLDEYHESGTPVFKHPILLNEVDTPYSVFVGNDIFIQLSFGSPTVPKGFHLFAMEEQLHHIYIAIRTGSEVDKRLSIRP